LTFGLVEKDKNLYHIISEGHMRKSRGRNGCYMERSNARSESYRSDIPGPNYFEKSFLPSWLGEEAEGK